MNAPPIVTPNMPMSYPNVPNGQAYGAPTQTMSMSAVTGMSVNRVLGCPDEIAPELKDIVPASWPTWMKVLAGLSALSLLAIVVGLVVRHRR